MHASYDDINTLLRDYEIGKLTYNDIRIHLWTGQDRSVYQKGADGRNHLAKSMYRHGIMTDIGDIRADVWYELAKMLINREYDGWLTDALEEWYTYLSHKYNHNVSKKEVWNDSMSGTISRIYDRESWVYYIPFNRKYRPHVLNGKTFLTTLSSCCNKPGQIPREVNHFSGRYYCPHCGRWSEAKILGEGPLDEQ